MKFYKQIIFILVVFFKTETLLSESSLFSVNNIQLERKDKIKNNELANQAIKKGFNSLIEKILLKEDGDKLSDLKFSSIKQLVTYYQISETASEKKNEQFVNFNVKFDKEKIHELFYNKGIQYSEILDKELYTLPILINDREIYIFNNNFFYENWNLIHQEDLIEFILPLENIEIIQNINQNKKELINLNIDYLFKEYQNKNLAFILIINAKGNEQKIYLKTKIQGKKISKSFNFKKQNFNSSEFNRIIISEIKKELINIVKSENLIDIRTPSFLNVKFYLNKKSNFVDLNSKMQNIDLIENIFVQEFNKDYMKLRIKYLGKLEKIINQLNDKKINLQLTNDQWVIKTL